MELVTSLSVELFIQALQRFMSRRGVPQLCISDHGTNFVAAAKWVREKNLDIKGRLSLNEHLGGEEPGKG